MFMLCVHTRTMEQSHALSPLYISLFYFEIRSSSKAAQTSREEVLRLVKSQENQKKINHSVIKSSSYVPSISYGSFPSVQKISEIEAEMARTQKVRSALG